MKQNPRFDLSDIDYKFRIYAFLKDYYMGNLWDKLGIYGKVFVDFSQSQDGDSEILNRALQLIRIQEAEAIYDFNRLFLGPGNLLAPPYESSYRNPEGLLMQKETMDVRKFYSAVGVGVKNRNSQPDDSLALQFEFVCYLLFRAASHINNEPDKTNYYMELYLQFIEEHIGKWIFKHCQDVLNNSKTDFCRGMAEITQSFIAKELKEIA